MAFPYRRILNPVDFDDNSLDAMDVAAEFARQNDGIVFALHVVPMNQNPAGGPAYVELYHEQAERDRARLEELVLRRFHGLKYQVDTDIGDPASIILKAERTLAADVVVMATHGRKGFSHLFLGSTVESVLRAATCPVLVIRRNEPDRNLVGRWMSCSPVVVAPEEELPSVEKKMHEGSFHTLPVVAEGQLVGIITDRELRAAAGHLNGVQAKTVMTAPVITLSPDMTTREAARLLQEHKTSALPVVEGGQLVGMLSTIDLLEVFTTE
jgi:nucleotide-binding universal stress UspA family protein/predicted transcriptional regulator